MSDPHSAEAPVWRDAWRTFQDPYLGPDTEKFPSPFESFVAGYIAAVRSRDAEVAELKAKIAAELALSHGPFGPWDDDLVSWDDLVKVLGSASSPVEGDPAETRESTCVANWPECFSGGYDPRCCRFPKECSVRMVPVEGGN